MRVYKRVGVFVLIRLCVHACIGISTGETNVDFPSDVYINIHSYKKHVKNVSWNYHNIYKHGLTKVPGIFH